LRTRAFLPALADFFVAPVLELLRAMLPPLVRVITISPDGELRESYPVAFVARLRRFSNDARTVAR
jgi:hypothetical protein